MAIVYYGYPKCTTCRKAKKWLDEHGVDYEERNIKETPPAEGELRDLIRTSGLELKKFFNTSGMSYRELGLKDRLPDMTDDEKIALLASDGMLLKRPIVTDGRKVTVGFREPEFENAWD
ncbi:arsenate reductase family protein [Bhargavaea cecembensis]|uniref:arsenate reductase family protein n=1 Tax=Bhargavaea cecembensis TaxID=394098 RepID=UPI00058F1CC3|nr:arsenate reductase family protein [Bhargavaea cecembensis]